jgi:hypothetical protein
MMLGTALLSVYSATLTPPLAPVRAGVARGGGCQAAQIPVH